MNENDDEEQLGLDDVQDNINPIKEDNFENNNQPVDSLLPRSDKKNSRLGNRKQSRRNRDRVQQEQQLDNGEEMEKEYNAEDMRVRKRRLL